MKSGFVAVVGRPNVGKSTLLNAILKKKISITSPKPQTTRNSILGIYNQEDAQIVFVDTPGVHKPYFKLGEYMNKVALTSTKDVEAIILLVDASKEFSDGDQFLVDHLKVNAPLFIVFNKIDLTNMMLINELKLKYQSIFHNAQIIEISALTGVNIDLLLAKIKDSLKEGPCYFPLDQITDRSDNFIISEIIREKIMLLTREEIPHSVAVNIEKLQREKDNLIIHATIIVERDSQKGIIIGKRGKMIKKIGILARQELEKYFNSKVNLLTFVRVEKEWRDSIQHLKEFGYTE